MILIADSGSTKTDWRLIHASGQIEQFTSIGLNPFHLADEMILATVRAIAVDKQLDVQELFFYGAGVGSKIQHTRLSHILQNVFSKANINVEHDLLGAARAACGKRSGLAVILGTGTNSCLYNGTEITEHIPSVGYILGDFGSGADLGKRWANACLTSTADAALIQSFYSDFNLDADKILQGVYADKRAQAFLASFAPFLAQNRHHPFAANLVAEAFNELFEQTLTKYSWHKQIDVCGSIGHIFRNELARAAESHGCVLGNVIQSPIAALTLYHSE
jgi:glucosamine kinase